MKKDKPQIPEKIKFKYIFEDDYSPIYSNGAFGGITPNHEIVVNFFFERQGLPYSQTHIIKEKGMIGEIVEINPDQGIPYLIRQVQNGIILSLDGAKKIHTWIGEKIQELEDVQNVSNPSNK